MLWAASPTEPGFPPRGRAHAGGSGWWLRLPLAGLPGPPCAQACLLPDKEWHDCMQEGVCGVLGYRDLCLQGQTQRGPWARPFSRPVALSLVRAIRAHPPWPWLVISVPAVEGPGRGSISLVARPSCVLSWWSWKSGMGRTRGEGQKDSLLLASWLRPTLPSTTTGRVYTSLQKIPGASDQKEELSLTNPFICYRP